MNRDEVEQLLDEIAARFRRLETVKADVENGLHGEPGSYRRRIRIAEAIFGRLPAASERVEALSS